MNTLEAILTRRSTRKFLDKTVDPALVQQIVEAGRHAPSGGNSQTTHFFVITDPAVREQLRRTAEKSFAAMEVTPGMYRSLANSINNAKRGGYNYDYHAPVLIVTANKRGYGNAMSDCCCAIENMMIAANSLDLGTCYINQLNWLGDDPDTLALMKTLGLQDDERVFASLVLGLPDTADGLPNRTVQPRTGNPVTFI